MTPAERARQIDREEFAAECAAIRQRAYALLNREPDREPLPESRIKLKETAGSIRLAQARKTGVEQVARMHAANANYYSAFGHTRTLKEWAAETGISSNTIRNRLNIGWTIEDAVSRDVAARRNFQKVNHGTA